MSFPTLTPTTDPINAALSFPINLVKAPRDPTAADVSYTPGQSEWLNTSSLNYWKYKGVQIVSGNAQAIWELLTTVTQTRDPNSSDNFYTIGTLWSNTSTNEFWALTSFSGSSAQWQSLTNNPSPSGVLQLTPQDLNVVQPNGSGNININGGTSGFLDTVRTSVNTLTIRESGILAALYGGTGSNALTANGVVIAQGAATMHATSAGLAGQPLLSGGNGVDPNWGTLSVGFGGTGSTSFTAFSVLCGGLTSTSALQNVSGVGTSGQVLTSNGAGTLPTWQTPSDNPSDNCAFYAYLAADVPGRVGAGFYPIGSGGNPLTVDFDTGGNFSAAGTFTAPANGKYFFVMAASTSASGVTGLIAGPTAQESAEVTSGNGAVSVSAFFNLTATQTVTFQVRNNGGGSATLSGVLDGAQTYVNGWQVA